MIIETTTGGPSPDDDWLAGHRAIRYQRCGSCGEVWYLPRKHCPACGAGCPERLTASGDGVVHAITLVSRAPTPAFREVAPYLLIFVDAVEGFRMMAHGAPDLRIGDRVHVGFVERAGHLLPLFSAAPQNI